MCPPLPRVGFLTVDNCVALVCAVIARRAVGQRFDAVAVVIRHPLGDVRLALGEKCVLLCEFSFSLCVCMLVFVPSLSWQMVRGLVYIHKRTAHSRNNLPLMYKNEHFTKTGSG